MVGIAGVTARVRRIIFRAPSPSTHAPMRKPLVLLLVLASLAACRVNVVRTVKPEPAPSASTVADMRQAMTAAMEASKNAWNAADIAGHVALYTDSATMMTPSGLRRGKEAIRQGLERSFWTGGKPQAQLAFSDLEIRPLGSDHALMTGAFLLTYPDGHTAGGRYSLTWVREGGAWKVMHDDSH